jgi:hypothetical protein
MIQDVNIIVPSAVSTLLILMQHPHVDVATTLGAILPLSHDVTRVVVVLMPCCLDVSRFAPCPPVAVYELLGMATSVALCEVFELNIDQVHSWAKFSLLPPNAARTIHHMTLAV